MCGEAIAVTFLVLYYMKFLLSSQVICAGSTYFLAEVVICCTAIATYAENDIMHERSYKLAE